MHLSKWVKYRDIFAIFSVLALIAAEFSGIMTTTSSSAFLSSFYIYNPSFGQTDVSLHEQLIFHYSSDTAINLPVVQNLVDSKSESQKLDRQLRAIGLAQGIVEFARAFSPSASVQEIRTQKGFTLPVEVEKSCWILAVQFCLNTP
jgi:First Longin domain of INTU, CCZ1 and HPS4